jgi:hypothetical protein
MSPDSNAQAAQLLCSFFVWILSRVCEYSGKFPAANAEMRRIDLAFTRADEPEGFLLHEKPVGPAHSRWFTVRSWVTSDRAWLLSSWFRSSQPAEAHTATPSLPGLWR